MREDVEAGFVVFELILMRNRKAVSLGNDSSNSVGLVIIRLLRRIIRLLGPIDIALVVFRKGKPVRDMGVGAAFGGSVLSAASSKTSSATAGLRPLPKRPDDLLSGGRPEP